MLTGARLQSMEENTYPDPAVIAEANNYISIKVINMEKHEIEEKYGLNIFQQLFSLIERVETTRRIDTSMPNNLQIL